MAVVRAAGVNDEPSDTWDLDEGLDVLDELGIKFVELRAAYGKMVDVMDEGEFRRVARRVQQRGFTVTTYLGQLGQCVLDAVGRAADEAKLRRAVERAEDLGTTQLRIMGYRKGEDTSVDWAAAGIEQFKVMTEIVEKAGKVLVLENPPNLTAAICTAPQCLDAMHAVNSSHFRMNFDPGNFGSHGEIGSEAFPLLKDFIANVHVKDIRVPDDKRTYCPAGEGICGYPEVFKGLAEMGYDGVVTAEPHLTHTVSHHTSGREGFIDAAEKMIALLEASGFEVLRA